MEYKREYKKYLTASVLDTANNKIASSTFITAFAVYLGLSTFAIGIYSVLDTITNIIQIFAAPIFSKIGQSKFVVLLNYSIYRLASVCFAFIPFISDDISIRTTLFFIFASIYAITGELGYVLFVNWRMTLLRKEDRTKFTATRNIFKNTIVVAFSLLMGVILDYYTKNGNELYGFLILFTLVFIIAFVDIFIRIKTFKPNVEMQPVSIKETISIPAKDKKFRRVLIITSLFIFADWMKKIYLNVYLLRYLNVNYLYYSILNIIINLSDAIISKYWSSKVKDRKWSKILIPSSVLNVTALILLLIGNRMLIYILPLIYILFGLGSSAYEIFDSVAVYENSKEKYQTSYITFERFIEGIIVSILPILSLALPKDNIEGIKITFIISIIAFIILTMYLVRKNKTTVKEEKADAK